MIFLCGLLAANQVHANVKLSLNPLHETLKKSAKDVNNRLCPYNCVKRDKGV